MQLRQVEPPAPEGARKEGGRGEVGGEEESGGRVNTLSTPCCGVCSSAVQDPGTGLEELRGDEGRCAGSEG